jgi:hypothetical protein
MLVHNLVPQLSSFYLTILWDKDWVQTLLALCFKIRQQARHRLNKKQQSQQIAPSNTSHSNVRQIPGNSGTVYASIIFRRYGLLEFLLFRRFSPFCFAALKIIV